MIGQTIAGLELVSQFGETRSCELFVGECADGRCAVKLVRSELAGDPARVERAFAAARAAGALDHRGIEFVIEAAWDGDRAYLLGDLVPGTPAAKRVVQRVFEPEMAASIVRYAADALAAAHAIGAHHHALEPLLVHLGFAADRVVVRDFGLAALADGATSAAYRAPELWGGDGGAGAPADVYALGAIAIELMCGHGPFAEASERAHRDDAAAAARTWVPEIPPLFDDLIARMLSKDPAMRPTMSEVRDELGGLPREAAVAARTLAAAVAATPRPAAASTEPVAPGLRLCHRCQQPSVAAHTYCHHCGAAGPVVPRDVESLMAHLAATASDEVTPPPGPPPEPES